MLTAVQNIGRSASKHDCPGVPSSVIDPRRARSKSKYVCLRNYRRVLSLVEKFMLTAVVVENIGRGIIHYVPVLH